MKDKIITLKNGKEFLIIDVCTYKNIDYCFACEVVNDEPTEAIAVIRIDEVNGKNTVTAIQDKDIVENVCEIVDRNLSRN